VAGIQGSAGATGANGNDGAQGPQGEPASRNLALAPLADVSPKDIELTPLFFDRSVQGREGVLGGLGATADSQSAIRVPDSGVYRVTVSVRLTSRSDYRAAALQIGTVDKGQGPEFFASQRSGPEVAGVTWILTTAVIFLEKDEHLTGYLTISGSNDVSTDRGWFVIEKLTP
jgi:hypothetical protein